MATDIDQGLPLATVLRAVAEQLLLAEQQGTERPKPVMKFEECEIELAVKIEGSAKAGIKVWVLEFGGGVKREDATKLKVKFKAIEGSIVQMPSTHDGPAEEVIRE